MTSEPGNRRHAGPLGLAAAAVVGIASVALIAASPVRSRGEATPPSAGRTLDIRVAEAARPVLQPASAATPLDVRPIPVDAPISPELASAQADADLRAEQAAEARQLAADAALERREQARIDALINAPYLLHDATARDPEGDVEAEDDAADDGA